jgi:tetratricopeptide (TPR) repeat protein
MSIRLPTAQWVPAALLAAGLCLPAAAKPPDLPMQEKIVCEPTAVPAPGPAAEEDDLHARAAEETVRRTVRRCLLFAANPLLGLLPLDEWLEGDGDEETSDLLPAGGAVFPDGLRIGVDFNTGEGLAGRIAPSPDHGADPDTTCPYLREKAGCHRAAVHEASEAPGSVVENLEKLEHAARAYRRAESYRRLGRLVEARACYESIRELCPGSRFARLADERLQQLPAGEATGEEEEVPPPTLEEPTSEKHSAAGGGEKRVSGLLERCQRAFAGGRYGEAEILARRAITLDPDAVAANPLVYKLHLLRQLRNNIVDSSLPAGYGLWGGDIDLRLENSRQATELMLRFNDFYRHGLYSEAEFYALQALAIDPENRNAQAAARLAAMQRLAHPPVSEPAVCPWASEVHTTMRQPDLPPVDPMTAGVMDKILIEIGEPVAEKMTVTVEEQGAAEEEAEPPSAEDPPILPIDAPGDDPSEQAGQNLSLQDLLDALRSSACVEVESTPLCGRGQCQVPLGMLSARAEWDCRGEHGSFMLSLAFGETPDLRAEQWEYNDRVADWITRQSEGMKQPDDGWQP